VNKKIQILIAERIPSQNKGEVTILGGIIESLKQAGVDFEISMFSDEPEVDTKRYEDYNIKIIDIRSQFHLYNPNSTINKLFSSIYSITAHFLFGILYYAIGQNALRIFKSDLWKSYATADVIVVGHNGTFGVIGGKIGIPLYMQLVYIPLLGKFLNKKVVLYSGSIPSPPKGKFMRLVYDIFIVPIMRLILSKLDLITVRGKISYENGKRLYNFNNLKWLPDVAYLLPVKQNTHFPISESTPIIGIIVTEEKARKAFSKNMSPEESYEYHNEIFAKYIDTLVSNNDFHVLFVPHCIRPDDRKVARNIYSKISSREKVTVLETELPAEEIKGLLSNLALLITERVHAGVNAVSVGVPTVVILDKEDIRWEVLEFSGAIYLPLEGLTPERLYTITTTVFFERSTLRKYLLLNSKKIKRLARFHGILLRKVLFRE